MASEIGKLCAEISNEVVKETWYDEATDSIIAIRKEMCECEGIKPLLDKYDELCLKIHCSIEERIFLKMQKGGKE